MTAISRPPAANTFALCLLLLGAGLLCAPRVFAQAQPIDLNAPPPQWQAVFASLSGRPRIEATFSERRFFPFRRFPLRTEGVMVYNSKKGFALDYTQGRKETVFIRPQGVFLARGEGKFEAVPQSATAAASLKVMPLLMDFTPQKLAEDFSASGHIDDDGSWQFNLKPLVPGGMPGIQEIRMTGAGDLLQQLVLVRAANERSEITIHSVRFPQADEPLTLNWPADDNE